MLVGGSSKIPLVSELLINQIGVPAEKLNRSINADEAVARGAAVFAAQLSDRCLVKLEELHLNLRTSNLFAHFCAILSK